MSISPEDIVDWEHRNIIFHVILSGMALQYYDFFQTIELEVEYIWKARFNLLKLTYILTKYLPYFDVPLLALGHSDVWTVGHCRALNLSVSCFFAIGLLTSEVILTLRTWGLWGRPRWLTCVIACIGFVTCSYGVTILHSGLTAVKFTRSESASDPFRGCMVVTSVGFQTSKLWVLWVLQLFYDGLLCALLIARVMIQSREGQISGPLYLIYKDGISYYMYLFLITAMLLLWLVGLHQDFFVPVSILTRIVHPLFAARVVLHARQQVTLTSLPSSNIISTTINL